MLELKKVNSPHSLTIGRVQVRSVIQLLSGVLEDITVVLHCCQGDLGDTVDRPGSSEDTGLGPGLGVRGPGQDGVHGILAITTAASHMNHQSKSGSPETRARGGKLAGLPPPFCRGGVVQQLGAGQALVPIIGTGDDEDLDRDTAPPAIPALPGTSPSGRRCRRGGSGR